MGSRGTWSDGRQAERIVLIGAGVAGTALATALRRAGLRVVAVASRRLASARRAARLIGGAPAVCRTPEQAARAGTLVLLGTPDRAIGPTARRLARAGGLCPGHLVVHLSGALPASGLPVTPATAAALHPVASLASHARAVATLGSGLYALEGPPAALRRLRRLVRALGGKAVTVPAARKGLYHAGCALASNAVVAVLAAALHTLQAAGLSPAAARAVMRALAGSTWRNVEEIGIPAALTGPIARGDVPVVAGHLRALGALLPALVPLYRELGRVAVEVGRAKGSLKRDPASRLRRLLAPAGSPATRSVPGRQGPRRSSVSRRRAAPRKARRSRSRA